MESEVKSNNTETPDGKTEDKEHPQKDQKEQKVAGTQNSNHQEDLPLDIICYIRERDEARTLCHQVETDLKQAQVRIYDLTKTIEEQEKGLSSSAGNKSPAKVSKKAKTLNGGNKLELPKDKKGLTSPKKIRSRSGSLNKSRRGSTSSQRSTNGLTGRYHPPIDGLDNLDQDTHVFYTSIGERFPDIPLSVVLNAECKFISADVNRDGTIDGEELDAVLSANHFLLTPKQLEKILQELDVDHTASIDFLEVLMVLDRLGKRKRSDLPLDIQEKKSQICLIQ